MPIYTYRCEECGLDQDLYAPAERRDETRICRHCDGDAERVFTPTANIVVPTAFGMRKNWHLPPRGHPSWENMHREGTIKPEPEGPSFREFCESEGQGTGR